MVEEERDEEEEEAWEAREEVEEEEVALAELEGAGTTVGSWGALVKARSARCSSRGMARRRERLEVQKRGMERDGEGRKCRLEEKWR